MRTVSPTCASQFIEALYGFLWRPPEGGSAYISVPTPIRKRL